MLKEHSFTGAKYALNYAEGPPAGPPLILLHGVVRSWQDYLTMIPTLATRWHVHALDFRGHGRSGHADSYLVTDYVADVTKFIQARFDEPVVLYGHSLGGLVAAGAGAEDSAGSRLVRALVLEDPPFTLMGERIGETFYLEMFQAYQGLARRRLAIEELARELGAVSIPKPPGAGPGRALLRELRDPTALRFTARGLARLDPEVLTPIIAGRWLERYDVPGTLARIAAPTLILQGNYALGGVLPDAEAADIAARIRRSTHVRMPEVGHQLHSLATEATLRHVMAFLETID